MTGNRTIGIGDFKSSNTFIFNRTKLTVFFNEYGVVLVCIDILRTVLIQSRFAGQKLYPELIRHAAFVKVVTARPGVFNRLIAQRNARLFSQPVGRNHSDAALRGRILYKIHSESEGRQISPKSIVIGAVVSRRIIYNKRGFDRRISRCPAVDVIAYRQGFDLVRFRLVGNYMIVTAKAAAVRKRDNCVNCMIAGNLRQRNGT